MSLRCNKIQVIGAFYVAVNKGLRGAGVRVSALQKALSGLLVAPLGQVLRFVDHLGSFILNKYTQKMFYVWPIMLKYPSWHGFALCNREQCRLNAQMGNGPLGKGLLS